MSRRVGDRIVTFCLFGVNLSGIAPHSQTNYTAKEQQRDHRTAPTTRAVHPSFVPTQFDAEKAGAFVGKVVTDCAATVSVALAVIGDQLGLYRAMAGGEPLTSVGAGAAHQYERALRPRVADQPGRRRLHRLRSRHAALLACPTSRRWRSSTRTAPSTSAAR